MKPTEQTERVLADHNFYKDKIHGMGIESYSGRGSCFDTTEDIRRHLPNIIKEYNIKSIIDAPCGDFNWMRHVDLSGVDYKGFDALDVILESNITKYGSDSVEFIQKDLISEDFDYKADLILCRDFMFHIDTKSVLNLLENFKKSGSRYLLSTTFNRTITNTDIGANDKGYGFRQINLLVAPFNMGEPIFSFDETHTENHGRSMHLWDLKNI